MDFDKAFTLSVHVERAGDQFAYRVEVSGESSAGTMSMADGSTRYVHPAHALSSGGLAGTLSAENLVKVLQVFALDTITRAHDLYERRIADEKGRS